MRFSERIVLTLKKIKIKQHARKFLLFLLFAFIFPFQGFAEESGKTYSVREKFKDCLNCPEMIVIPEGSFMMGMDDGRKIDGPAHEVNIKKPFAVGIFPVTVGQFRYFINQNPDKPLSHCTDYGVQGASSTLKGRTWDKTGFPQEDDHPVVCLSWYDMQEYLKWLNKETGKNYRLLSEAEWEYIARAGNEGPDSLRALANHNSGNFGAPYEECCKGDTKGQDEWLYTSPVNAFPANEFGVHDMNGNAEVLVLDCVNSDYLGAPTDGSAWTGAVRLDHKEASDWVTTDGQCFFRIYRGQAWKFPPAKNWFARRYAWPPHFGTTFIGFRVALDLP